MGLTSLVPVQMSLMWSQMALAADMALDSFLALMTAAPLCCTVCMKQHVALHENAAAGRNVCRRTFHTMLSCVIEL